jgi:hypothetical protein
MRGPHERLKRNNARREAVIVIKVEDVPRPAAYCTIQRRAGRVSKAGDYVSCLARP